MTDSCTSVPLELLGRSKPVHSCVSTGRCVSLCVSVCVNCWLLSSQQLYVGMRELCFGVYRPVEVGECGGCGSMCEWSLTSCPSLARVHTLTPSHLVVYMCPPGGHPILSASVCLSSGHSIPPDLLHMYIQRGALFLSFTMETGHVFIPSSFPLSRPAAGCEGHGCIRTGVHSSRHAGCPTSFSS